MSGRRDKRKAQASAADDMYRFFVGAPWWAPVVVAVVLGLLVAFVPPALLHTSSKSWYMLAGVVAVFVLVVGLAAMAEKGRRAKMLVRSRTLHDLRRLRWQDFEALVAEAYRRQGWSVAETGTGLGAGADGGIDLILCRPDDVVGVQCKKWAVDLVGVEKVRELQGALPDHGAKRGIFVSTGQFTPDAVAYAGRRGMELVDGEALLRMLPRRAVPALVEPAERSAEVTCPQCGSLMVQRRGRRGAFWGCRQYPRCRGTRPITA